MKIIYRRKSYMTLLETLIAMSLLSMLLVIVFGFFRELSHLTLLTEQAQKESFQMRYAESRLGFIFERLVNENKRAKSFYFYTQPAQGNFSPATSLIFTFNNEIRQDPTFSGDVLGRLYIDFNHCLCLAIWPLHASDPHEHLQQEVLLQQVMDIHYEFYASPERVMNANAITTANVQPHPIGGTQVDKDAVTQPEKDKWYLDEWAISHKQMPSIIKLTVQIAKDEAAMKRLERGGRGQEEDLIDLIFSFTLPSSKNYVHYPPD